MWPRAHCGIDHKLSMCKFEAKLKKKKKVPTIRFECILNIFKENLRNCFEILSLIDTEPEQLWNEIKQVIKHECKNRLPKMKKANWMREQTGNCQEEKRSKAKTDKYLR